MKIVCEAAGMRINTSKSAAMVLQPLVFAKEQPQAKELKNLGVEFTLESEVSQQRLGSSVAEPEPKSLDPLVNHHSYDLSPLGICTGP